jgi:hypothetical protein
VTTGTALMPLLAFALFALDLAATTTA